MHVSHYSFARAHEGPGGLLNPMQEQAVNMNTPRVDAGGMLTDDDFDKMIAAKFEPHRRRCDVIDFEPTIAVDYSRHTSECHEPHYDDDPHSTARGIGTGVMWGAAILFIVAIGLLPWLLSYIN